MDESSSDSPMEEGSLEGGGSEHEYDEYNMELDDERAEDAYDDAEEEDDDDMDDDDESADEPPFPLELHEGMSGFINHFRNVREAADLDDDDDDRSPAALLEALPHRSYGFFVDAPPPLNPESSFDSRVRETAAWLTNLDTNSFWQFVNQYIPHGPGAPPHAMSLPVPRFGPGSAGWPPPPDDRAARLHPALCRPRSPADGAHPDAVAHLVDNPSLDVLLSNASPLRAHAAAASRIDVEGRPSAPAAGRTDTSVDDAYLSLRSLVNILAPNDARPVPADPANGAPQAPPAPQPQPAAALDAPPEQMPRAAADGDEIMPQAQQAPASGPADPAPRSDVRHLAMMRAISQGRELRDALPDGHAFMLPSQLAAMDIAFDGGGPPMPFMQSVTVHGAPGYHGFTGRGQLRSRMARDRDRTSSTRRWTYDPPGNGGDELPSMFTGDPSSSRNQGHGGERRNGSNPSAMCAADSFESVNNLERKVMTRIAQLASDLKKIDSAASKEISDAKKKEKEEKKKAEQEKEAAEKEQQEKEEKEKAEAASEAAKADANAIVPDTPAPSTPAANGEGEPMQTEPAVEVATPVEGDESRNEDGNEAAEPAAIEVDVEVIDVDAEEERSQADGNAESGTTGAQAGENGDAAAAAAPNEEFPSVAAARAAAIGISLDAPATEDPSVIAAACESTGIDPTFLSALPEDMRSDVFNQLFDTMRNATPAAGSSSEQPVTTLNQDFLIALPPALRAEVLEAEADYQARNAPASGGDGAAAGGDNAQNNGPGDQMDNATFLATLSPDLREEILITSDENFLASLPPHVAAEARTLRERAAAANEMHHHGWGTPDDAPVMFRRNGILGAYIGGRREREAARQSRREDPGLRWEKIDGHWYRVGPKEETAIKSSLNDEALKSIIGLLKLSNSKNVHIRQVIPNVLTSACMNTDARKRVLSELLTMITSAKEKDTGSTDAGDSTVYASEATVVRRALDLLEALCQADVNIAEALIGLPSPPKKSSDSENIEPNQPVFDKLLSLSTLTSLLSAPLFKRSNTHLEKLLDVISLACKAIPSSRQGKLGDGRSRRSNDSVPSTLSSLLNRIERFGGGGGDDDDDEEEFTVSLGSRRRILERLEEGHIMSGREITPEEAAAAERQLLSMEDMQADLGRYYEGHPRRRRRISAPDSDDSEEEEQEGNAENRQADQEEAEAPAESAEEPATNNETANNEPANASGTNEIQTDAETTEGGTAAKDKDGKKEKKKKKPEVRIPAEYRVPKLSEENLKALVVMLRRPNFREENYETVSKSLGQLGELPSNRSITIAALADLALDVGNTVRQSYVSLKEELSTRCGEKDVRKKQIILKFAMGTSSSELVLLRLVKTAAALLNISSKKPSGSNKSSKKAEKQPLDPKILAELRENRDCVFRSLQDVWISLYEVLDLVESELDTQSEKKGSVRRASGYGGNRRNDGLARQTRTRNSRKTLTPVLARLSPTIEALFITHSTLVDDEEEKNDPKQPMSPRPMSPRDSVDSPSLTGKTPENKDGYIDEASSKYRQLGAFLARHRAPVNALLRANPSLLETSFKLALKHPHAIDFDNKNAYFRNLIRKRSSEAHASTLRINVRRSMVYTDSHQQLRRKTKDEMKGRLHVQFVGEEGIDAGGVTREWYTIVARQIFDANYALFCRSAAKAATYQPDKRSYINEEHLENFRFVGRFVAKAIYDGQHIDAYFTRAFYKHILGIKPTYRDIEAEDPDFYNSLKWMLENDITGVLDNTMSAEYEEFGQRKVVDLIPDGRKIQVTEENKAEYVRAVTEVRLTKAIEKQIEAFKEGFHELIPLEDCRIFNELELELVMSGLPDIDMADMKANVEYTGYTSSSPQINWFWRCVSQMDQEDLARLVMFVTGTSKVPLEGFSALQGMNGAQKFQIHRVAGDTSRLPSAHTCFNQLDLPEYSTAEVLAERILKAVRECNVGFGFA